MKVKRIVIEGTGKVFTRPISITDTKEEIKAKQQKPFILQGDYTLEVYLDNSEVFIIEAHNGYTFDGATIPFGLGKGDMKILIPALFHDIMCENHSLVKNNRKLSSDIFYELLTTFHNNKLKAKIMYLSVELWQKIVGKW